jgi:hypothetical protein
VEPTWSPEEFTTSPEAGPDEKWFCVVSKAKGFMLKFIMRTTDLKTAQRALGRARYGKSQAIIPMTGKVAGDPQSLTKDWGTGSMWWWGMDDIRKMQAKCRGH